MEIAIAIFLTDVEINERKFQSLIGSNGNCNSYQSYLDELYDILSFNP